MKYTECELENKLSQIDFSKELQNKDEMLNNLLCKLNGAKSKTRTRTHRLRYVLVTILIITAVFMMSSVAYHLPYAAKFGEILESLVFNGFNVNKVSEIIYPDNDYNIFGTTATWSYVITDPKVKKDLWFGGEGTRGYFETFEEAEKYLAFTPKGLNYIPEGYSFEHISLSIDGWGRYMKNQCVIRYTSDRSDEFFSIGQDYVGKDAKILLNTVLDIEKVMLNGDIKALLMSDDRIPTHYNLRWIKDGIGYLIMGTWEIEELIKMAESIE